MAGPLRVLTGPSYRMEGYIFNRGNEEEVSGRNGVHSAELWPVLVESSRRALMES